MKTVFSNDECFHIWASQSQDEGRNGTRSVSFSGVRLRSYSWTAAIFCTTDGRRLRPDHSNAIRGPEGRPLVLFSAPYGSITTRKHQGQAMRAVSQHEAIWTPLDLARLQESGKLNREWRLQLASAYQDVMRDKLEKCVRARYQLSPARWHAREACDMAQLAAFFGGAKFARDLPAFVLASAPDENGMAEFRSAAKDYAGRLIVSRNRAKWRATWNDFQEQCRNVRRHLLAPRAESETLAHASSTLWIRRGEAIAAASAAKRYGHLIVKPEVAKADFKRAAKLYAATEPDRHAYNVRQIQDMCTCLERGEPSRWGPENWQTYLTPERDAELIARATKAVAEFQDARDARAFTLQCGRLALGNAVNTSQVAAQLSPRAREMLAPHAMRFLDSREIWLAIRAQAETQGAEMARIAQLAASWDGSGDCPVSSQDSSTYRNRLAVLQSTLAAFGQARLDLPETLPASFFDLTHAGAIRAWRQGAPGAAIPHNVGVLLRLNTWTSGTAEIQTSWGARVPVSVAPQLWEMVSQCRRQNAPYIATPGAVQVGVYSLSQVGADGSLTVGCHHIPYSEIEGIARALGYLDNKGETA